MTDGHIQSAPFSMPEPAPFHEPVAEVPVGAPE
jgi:hypothetical protein